MAQHPTERMKFPAAMDWLIASWDEATKKGQTVSEWMRMMDVKTGPKSFGGFSRDEVTYLRSVVRKLDAALAQTQRANDLVLEGRK